MPSFAGKIGFPDIDMSDVAAVMTVDDGFLEIHTGDTSIGRWPVTEFEIEFGMRGYFVRLDGEELVLAPNDRYGFTDAIETEQKAASAKKTSRRIRKKARRARKSQSPAGSSEPKPDPAPAPKRTDRSVEDKGQSPQPHTLFAAAWAGTKKRQPSEPATKPIPPIPGLDDPDNVGSWRHRTEEPATLRERIRSANSVRKLGLVALVALIGLTILSPEIASLLLLVPAVAAVILAALGILDPSFARFRPASMTDVRLMMIGIAFFATSMAIATIF